MLALMVLTNLHAICVVRNAAQRKAIRVDRIKRFTNANKIFHPAEHKYYKYGRIVCVKVLTNKWIMFIVNNPYTITINKNINYLF